MRARDGCRLDATVWRPEGSGHYPVLLMRQPYGRATASTVVYAHPAWYAARGYVVAVQDVRGTGTSEGEFQLFAHEEADGAETATWAASLDGSDGQVGMYGSAYQANTQYLALAGSGPGDGPLRALAPAMGGWDIRTDWAFENGAFRLGPNLEWGLRMGFIKATHDGDRHAAQALRAAAQALPLHEARRTRPDVIRRFGHWTHYEQWLTHPEPGAFWDSFAPSARLSGHASAGDAASGPGSPDRSLMGQGLMGRALTGRDLARNGLPDPALPRHAPRGRGLDVPMLHVGGWYDQRLMGTLAAHQAVAGVSRAEQALYVGPWTRQPWGRRTGAADFGSAAFSPIDPAQVAWFDRHLKGRDVPTQAGLTLFDVGARSWRRFAAWPTTRRWPLFLGGDGRATAACSGTLTRAAGPAEVDRIVHDPWRPAPVMGGHGSPPAGMWDRAAVDDRGDVAVYDCAPLERPVFLCGPVCLMLASEADQPSFDIDAVLSMLAPDGRAWTLTQGHARIDASIQGVPQVYELLMRAVCVTIPPGYAVRLSLAGAAAPSYAVNPGTGAPAVEFMAPDERVITIAIRHGGATASCLVLPEVT